MDETPNLSLPYLMPSQAQKHVTHNEALGRLDAVVQLSVVDRDLTAPPGAPEDGNRYIVGAGATGAWSGWDLSVAVRLEGAWLRFEPREGWLCWIEDEDTLVCWDGAAWANTSPSTEELQDVALLGLGTTADGGNPFAAKLNGALWTAKSAGEGGSGNLQIYFNKESAGSVLSLLLETGYSGRAEIGLVGNDDLSLRVSPDGGSWKDAIIADKDDGKVRFPQGVLDAATFQPARSIVFPSWSGDGVTTVWRSDTARTDNPRTATISSVSSDTITITTSEAQKFGRFTSYMAGCAYVRIWNASKAPEQSAWVLATPSATTIQVTDASAVSGWSNGETIRIGDPSGVAPVPSFAVDISPMQQALFGTVFRQAGLLLRMTVAGSGGTATLSVSEAAITDSLLMPVKSAADGTSWTGQIIVPTTVLSPISNSNLLFIREQGSMSVAAINVLGFYG